MPLTIATAVFHDENGLRLAPASPSLDARNLNATSGCHDLLRVCRPGAGGDALLVPPACQLLSLFSAPLYRYAAGRPRDHPTCQPEFAALGGFRALYPVYLIVLLSFRVITHRTLMNVRECSWRRPGIR